MYTEEAFDLYNRYQNEVHKQPRTKSDFKRFYCNGVLYDPEKEPHKANSKMWFKQKNIDLQMNVFKDEGVYPEALGTYHMYHRIDGKLVAIGVIDICSTFLNSAYFIYDPDYRFLNLGVVGAIRELEYMKRIRDTFNPEMLFY